MTTHRDLTYALEAWKVVTAQAEKNAPHPGEFRARARALPSMLVSMGLAGTATFLKGRPASRKADAALYAALTHRLTGDVDLVDHLCKPASDADYVRLSAEARTYAGWLSRLSDAEISATPRDDGATA